MPPVANPAKCEAVQDALQDSIRLLQDAGVETARLDAQLLLAWALGGRREDLAREPMRTLTPRERLIFRKALQLRCARRPLPYITGEQEFYGRSFKINRAVLIPRPETELLVDFAKKKADDFAGAIRIADIGAGSGAIAVSLACELPSAKIWAADVSLHALKVALKNVRRHGVEDRVALVASDLFSELGGLAFEIVVANPPYVAPADWPILMPEVRDYEPELALTQGAGPEGISVHRRLLTQAKAHLALGGLLALEVGLGQAERVAQMAREHGYTHIEAIPDLAGIPRVVAAQWGREGESSVPSESGR